MSFSMGCFFLMTGLFSCAVARGCENVCCLTLFQIPFYFAMLFGSLFIPNCESQTATQHVSHSTGCYQYSYVTCAV